MLDKAIHKHLDVIDEIQAEVQRAIEAAILSIDVKELIKDPYGTMKLITDEIFSVIVDKHLHEATVAGDELSKTLKKYDKSGKEIVVQDSNDPSLNKDIVGDKSNSEK